MRIVQGDLRVFQALVHKKRLLCQGDPGHTEYRIGLIAGDGVLLGAYTAGYCCALQEAGLFPAFDAVAGISTSIPTIGFSLAGQAHNVAEIYWGDCPTEGFFKLGRRPPMDVDWLGRIFEDRLDQGGVRASRPTFYAVLRRLGTGRLEFFDMKQSGIDIVAAMRAGIAAPTLSHGRVLIGGVWYGDARPHIPIQRFVQLHNLSHLLVLLNYPVPTPGDKNWDADVSAELISALLQKDCSTVLISGGDDDAPIRPLERDGPKLRRAAENAEAFFAAVLKQAEASD